MVAQITGTDAAEVFSVRSSELPGGSIDGGGGADILELRDFLYPELFDFTALTTFKNIEAISAVLEIAQVRIRADQLAGVTTLDSSDVEHTDQLIIVGNDIDLRDKSFVGPWTIQPENANAMLHVGDVETAMLIDASTVRGTQVEILSGELTDAQRVALYDHGIDVVTDSRTTTTAAGPTLTGLQGDAIHFKRGEEFKYLDWGSDATVSVQGHLASLVVRFTSRVDLFDMLDLKETASIKIGARTADGDDSIIVDGVTVGGAYRDDITQALHFTFNENATAERVQKLIRDISYQNSLAPSSGSLGVEFVLTDAGGRTAKATATIQFGSTVPPSTTEGTGLIVGTSRSETLRGGDTGDTIFGGSGNDTVFGGGGNDQIHGQAGRDVLYGNLGRDAFIFDTKITKKTYKKHMDKIADFSRKDDSIYLENKVFKKLGKKGSLTHPKALAKGYFHVGTKAHDANDHIIYNKKKGILYYDDDGIGAHKAIIIATLTKHPKINHHDFFVI
jgi:Ca2+-binding RTX toxin-like protein